MSKLKDNGDHEQPPVKSSNVEDKDDLAKTESKAVKPNPVRSNPILANKTRPNQQLKKACDNCSADS